MEEFSAEEREALSRFCSNTDKPIFALKNLPEVIKGALFSRYSRSTKSLRRLLLDDFLYSKDSGLQELAGGPEGPDLSSAAAKAGEFYNRVLDGFGDDSVGELGGAHLAIEDISIVATKIIEDARIGGSPLEKSTRYVYFDRKDGSGKWKYCREQAIMASKFADDYEKTLDGLFEAYSGLVPPFSKYVEEAWPIDEFEFAPDRASVPTQFGKISGEKAIKRAKSAYAAAVRAKVCDELRYLLPAATLTNMGVFGNGRFWQGLVSKLYSNPLAEAQRTAWAMHGELSCVIGPFVRRAKKDEYICARAGRMGMAVCALEEKNEEADGDENGKRENGGGAGEKRVELVDYDGGALEKVVAACIYPYSHEPMKKIMEKAGTMSAEEKKKIIENYAGGRKTRRDRPGRAFEQAHYEFDVCADYGAYRDLHRHRMLSQERQLLSCRHGYEIPEGLEKAGGNFIGEYEDAVESVKELFFAIESKMPHEAQYCVPLGFRIRWRMKMNLREACNLCELRSGMQGHASYRRIAISMADEIARVHPQLAAHMVFVDRKEYPLGRLQAEMKKENALAGAAKNGLGRT